MYALVKQGLVQNVIVADPTFIAQIAPNWDRIVLTNSAQIGWLDDGTNLTPPPEPPTPPPAVPYSITMRQARLALLTTGLLSNVDAAISELPSPEKDKAQIEWQYSNDVQRHNGLVSALAPALGLTDAQIDALFIAGATL